jgi:N-acetylmuramoyl-L-alanine amidase
MVKIKRFPFYLNILVLLLFTFGCAKSVSAPPKTVTYYKPIPPPKPRPKETQPPLIAYIPPPQQVEPVIPKYIAKPKQMREEVVIIDPGHGGQDMGTHSEKGVKYQEKSLTLATSLMLRDYLEKMGYRTYLTRTDDSFIALEKRSSIANDKSPTLFVSVHFNSAPSKEAEGIEVFYYKSEENKSRSKDSKVLAENILRYVLKSTDAKSRGVRHGNFAVIRETKMPAILIEGGFLTNDQELQKIQNASYLKKIAWGIAQGVDAYLRK